MIDGYVEDFPIHLDVADFLDDQDEWNDSLERGDLPSLGFPCSFTC